MSPGQKVPAAEKSAAPKSIEARLPRITPRNSDAEMTSETTATAKETPYETLRQLANVIPKPLTPQHRASSVGPSLTTGRTPTAQARTPGAGQRLLGSAKRTNILTPHGRAAVREIELRRAGLTPGKDRRRSGRQQRETPRDILRALSRTLAPATKPIESSPPPQVPSERLLLPIRDVSDDEADGERPRLSLPLGDDEDEDDSFLLPPQSAELLDDNFTVQSVELPRRATSEQPGRLYRGSFGSIRLSDRFADLNDLDSEGAGYNLNDSSQLGAGNFEYGEVAGDDITQLPGDGSDLFGDLALGFPISPGRHSDVRPAFVPDDDDQTFAFTITQQEEPADLVGERDGLEGKIDENPMDEDSESDEMIVERPEKSMFEDSLLETSHNPEIIGAAIRKPAQRRRMKISKHGIQYPSLPIGVVKKLAGTFARTGGNSKAKISKGTLEAIQQASDWFFEQASEDLAAFAKHAGRKTIDESDLITLMSRQRQINATTTPFSLAQRYLPRELLQEMRMVPPTKSRTARQLDLVEETDEG
ncbi:hypothetical protein BP5796_10341 [Coleophoma crateriformis]|uniref:CENP-T/Histone H4 histone fold domain-containing protein n=1 Tax=Coleophoma crateriformis TaxID=565419 RepID=A0A3D8QPV4_9HELO|nr:hypothetical protein BP5796_10341 [Coleophoma crateriformis]